MEKVIEVLESIIEILKEISEKKLKPRGKEKAKKCYLQPEKKRPAYQPNMSEKFRDIPN